MYLLQKPNLINFGIVKSHLRKSKKGTYLVKQFDRKNRDKKSFIKGAAVGSISTILIAGAASTLHPTVRKSIFKNIDFRTPRILLKKKIKANDLDFIEKKGAKTLKTLLNNLTPKTTKSFKVSTNKLEILKDLEEIKKTNISLLDNLNIPARKQRKIELQNRLISDAFDFSKLEENTYPDLMFRSYKNKKTGKLSAFTLLKPNKEYNALNLGTILTPEGSDVKGVKEVLEHTREVSRKLGYKGRIVGDPDENAIPLYKRYGAKQIEGTRYWLFEGDT
jgi:hypothetical protein